MIQSTIISERPEADPRTLYDVLKQNVFWKPLAGTNQDCQKQIDAQTKKELRPCVAKPLLVVVQEGHYSAGFTPGKMWAETRTELYLGLLHPGNWACEGKGLVIPMSQHVMMLSYSARRNDREWMLSRVWKTQGGGVLLPHSRIEHLKMNYTPGKPEGVQIALISGEESIEPLFQLGMENSVHGTLGDYLNGARALKWGLGTHMKKRLISTLYEMDHSGDKEAELRVRDCLEFKANELLGPVDVEQGVQIQPERYVLSMAGKYGVPVPVEERVRPRRG